MSPDDTPPAKPATTKDNDNQQGSGGGGGRKTSSSSAATRPQEQGLKCPRCDSPNTKFCYYNNYSLTQPRHFCKTCRRYWTKGGALRNVPIGGGCRKNKKVKSSRLSCDSNNSGSSSELGGGLKFLNGLSPSVDFHLGGLQLPFPRLQLHHHSQTTPMFNQFSSFADTPSASAINLDPSSGTPNSLAAINYPFSTTGYNGAVQGMSSMNIHTNLASSIESLSSMNQDLHWKLQQQRLAMMFGGENQKDDNNNNNNNSVSQVNNLENQTQKPQPILFQNLELSKPAGNGIYSVGNPRKEGTSGDTPTEWFFGNSYGSVTPTPTASSGGPGHENGNNWSSGGVHAWGDVQQQHQHQQYSALP